MRESRTYGSGRGACHEMHVPTATPAPLTVWHFCDVHRRPLHGRFRGGIQTLSGHRSKAEFDPNADMVTGFDQNRLGL